MHTEMLSAGLIGVVLSGSVLGAAVENPQVHHPGGVAETVPSFETDVDAGVAARAEPWRGL